MDFWTSVLTGVVGGVSSGLILAAAAAAFREYVNAQKDRKLNRLVVIMGQAVELRNQGKRLRGSIRAKKTRDWIRKARSLENRALRRADQISPVTGSFIKWLDRIDPWSDDREKYVAILSKVIERLRDILARNSVRF